MSDWVAFGAKVFILAVLLFMRSGIYKRAKAGSYLGLALLVYEFFILFWLGIMTIDQAIRSVQ